MYGPGNVNGPPPFGPSPTHIPPFRHGGPCAVPPPGQLPLGPGGPFSPSAPDSHFLRNRPPAGHFIRPPCSSFSIDHSTVIGSGGRQQIGPPVEPRHTQIQQWNPIPLKRHSPDNSDRAGEEFLRCIAANKPLPDYLKGNMAYNLADAFKSASVLKEAVKLDQEFQKHVTSSKSRSQSRSRSHGRSRGKSQPKSYARSKSRARSRSRGRSKSRARDKSRARNRGRTRSKSRAHSWSRSPSRSKKSHVRSKSRVRRSKSRSSSHEKDKRQNPKKDKKRRRSPSQICSGSDGNSNNLAGNRLLEGLKLVMNSKELEERLPTLKDAILTIQASDENKKVQCVPDEHSQKHCDNQDNSVALENDSMLLPHDRVGSDFSWLQANSQEDSTVRKADELEDEESFLYGNTDIGDKQVNESSTPLFTFFSQIGKHTKLQELDTTALGSQHHHLNKSELSGFGNLLDSKQPLQIMSSSLASSSLGSSEGEKIKNILKSLGTADISEIMVKMQSQKEKQLPPARPESEPTAAHLALPALSDPNVRQALESLQSLIKATKEKRAKTDGSGTSQISSDKHKVGDCEGRTLEKQARMSKMECLMKELEGLLKQDGWSFLTPVIGFYCQKCEEFIGDLKSAENHAVIHHHSNSISKAHMDKHGGDSKVHMRYFSSSSQQPHPSGSRKDQMDCDYIRGPGEHRNHRDYQQDRRDERDHRSKHNDDHRSNKAGQENISLKEEMKKERMLITVSCGLTPLSNVRVKEEVSKECQDIESNCKFKSEDSDSKGKSTNNGSQKDRAKDESSDCSDDEKEKTTKAKSSKKKKKKKDKKKKEKRNKS